MGEVNREWVWLVTLLVYIDQHQIKTFRHELYLKLVNDFVEDVTKYPLHHLGRVAKTCLWDLRSGDGSNQHVQQQRLASGY